MREFGCSEIAEEKQVPARGYYYLLDWNEQDGWKYIQRVFNKTRLCDLTLHEYKMLFNHATQEDYKNL